MMTAVIGGAAGGLRIVPLDEPLRGPAIAPSMGETRPTPPPTVPPTNGGIAFFLIADLCWLLGPSVLEKRYKTRKQPGALKKNRPLVSACHAGLLADNQTPVGSGSIIYASF
jgi:hypothetical protein